MTDIRSRLADALSAHMPWPSTDCRCGECKLSGAGGPADRRRRHEIHIADVLLELPGIAITALPEPDEDTGVFDAGCGAIAHVSEGDVRLHSIAWTAGVKGGVFRSPAMARALAAALLAAAVQAQEEQP